LIKYEFCTILLERLFLFSCIWQYAIIFFSFILIKSLLKVTKMDHHSLNDIVFVYSEREHSYWPAKVIDISQSVLKVKLFVLNQYELVKPKEVHSFQSN
jgi:hypothetical protein